MKKLLMKKTENLLNKKFMKEMVSSIIDMTEVYYDYQQNNEKELIDIKKWNEIIDNFIHNKPVIKRKKKKKVLTDEEIGNLNFDLNSPMDEEYSINNTEYEISEMKNYAYRVSDEYGRNKNNLFFQKNEFKRGKYGNKRCNG